MQCYKIFIFKLQIGLWHHKSKLADINIIVMSVPLITLKNKQALHLKISKDEICVTQRCAKDSVQLDSC